MEGKAKAEPAGAIRKKSRDAVALAAADAMAEAAAVNFRFGLPCLV